MFRFKKHQCCWWISIILSLGFLQWVNGQSGDNAVHHPVIQKIALTWLPAPVPESNKLKEQLRRFVGQPASSGVVQQIQKTSEKWLHQRAFYFPTVKIEQDSTQPGDLTVRIDTGKRLILGPIHFIWEPDSIRTLLPPAVLNRFYHRPYLPEVPKRIRETILTFLSNTGYPMATLTQERFEIEEKDSLHLILTLKVTAGPLVTLQDFLFKDKNEAENRYLQRLVGFHRGERYDARRIANYRVRLSRLPFVETVGDIHLVQDSLNRYFLMSELKEKPATAFDGVLGYVPPRPGEEKGYMVGNVTIGVRNLLGPGRELQLFWRKPDPLSENFHLAYRESFLLGLPLHLVGGLNRQVRDTTYIEWRYTAEAEIPITNDTRLTASVATRSVFPDTLASRTFRLPKTESVLSALTMQIDQRNSFNNPTRGFFLNLQFSLEQQRNIGPDYLILEDSLPRQVRLQRIEGQIDVFLRVWRNHVLSNAFHVKGVSSSGKRLYRPDLFYFGGSRTVRGYREDQFVSDRLVWVNTEYRVLTGPLSRIFLFVDNGAMRMPAENSRWRFLLGYGLGARFKGPLGLMQVELALARGEPFREAKIHFRLINEF